ncbi:MAG: DUF3047 domain-containing protein [Mariprofundaceae bacterium]|nr:DUF3047 domain-containing protein [Mariprofundaceae bacterium]
MGHPHNLRRLLLTGLFLLASGQPVFGDPIIKKILIGDFNQGSLAGWEQHGFEGRTTYRIEKDGNDTILKASSHHSASALYHPVRIDLTQTPFLHWRWRIQHILPVSNERQKSGDDFPARIYLISSGGVFFWNAKAINYVWSSREPVNASWLNPFTANSMMLSVESGAKHAGQWRSYKRNVRKDFKRLSGKDVTHLEAVAIMTDTDNTKSDARASYGDIYFSAN